jgi:hypothetical protein
MAQAQRTTVYFDPTVRRALRLKAVETNRPLSDLVNEAVREALAEDLEDIKILRKRAKEPSRPFETFLKELKHDGHI